MRAAQILSGFAINWPTRDRIIKTGVSSSLSCYRKLTDCNFADWNTEEICGFAICGLTL
jgi:hypothetical protein